MDKDYNLQCIDYAVAMTRERASQTPELAKLNSAGHLVEAIVEYMFNGNASGFSSYSDGRKYILELSKEDFEEQLLKHVVKSEAAKKKNGIVSKLGTNKTFGESLEQDDVQILLYKALNEMDMSGIKYILDKYPVLYRNLVSSFIEDRYFDKNLGEEKLDASLLDSQDRYYYNKIDEYYKQLKQVKGNDFQR